MRVVVEFFSESLQVSGSRPVFLMWRDFGPGQFASDVNSLEVAGPGFYHSGRQRRRATKPTALVVTTPQLVGRVICSRNRDHRVKECDLVS